LNQSDGAFGSFNISSCKPSPANGDRYRNPYAMAASDLSSSDGA